MQVHRLQQLEQREAPGGDRPRQTPRCQRQALQVPESLRIDRVPVWMPLSEMRGEEHGAMPDV
jgi:hypothetical protein